MGAETYGVQGPNGEFVPKIIVNVTDREVRIKKVEPLEKFRSISITLNRRNRPLVRNVALLKVRWVDTSGRLGRALPFAGPHYNPDTAAFQDSMTKSRALRIIDTTERGDLFAGRDLADLFTISIEGRVVTPAAPAPPDEPAIRINGDQDTGVKVDKESITFTEENYKKGEIINVANRTATTQTFGVSLPEQGLLYRQIIRKPEQTKVLRESWDRFPVEPDAEVSIVLIPEPDPELVERLDGREITVTVWDGSTPADRITIPIRVSPAVLGGTSAEIPGPDEPGPSATGTAEPAPLTRDDTTGPLTRQPATAPANRPAETAGSGRGASPVLWGLQILTLALVLIHLAYGVFFTLPRLQVLEDRLSKNEMFIHGSREAIREELDEIKEEILEQCRTESTSE